MSKSILLLLSGLMLGLILGRAWDFYLSQNEPDKVLLSQVKQFCPEYSFSQTLNKTSTTLTDPPHSNENCSQLDGWLDEIIKRILKGRSILPNELSDYEHWNDYDDFDQTINLMELNNSSQQRLYAKAEVYFHKNFVSALESLYGALQSASGTEESLVIQGEINSLIGYIKNHFFTVAPQISEIDFLRFMNIAHEKQPEYLPPIVALAKHHTMKKEYTLVENYIDSIPDNPDSQTTVQLLKRSLERTRTEGAGNKGAGNTGGIPMIKYGNQFVVKVNINDDISLNLLLDTGANRTVVGEETMKSMMALSNGIVDLNMVSYANTANGVTMIRIYRAETLEVGGFTLHSPNIFTSNLAHDDRVQGLLGMDFLGEFKFRLDHENNLLYLSR